MINGRFDTVLAIDTATSVLRLALRFGGDRLVKSAESAGRSHGQMIVRKIETLCESAGIALTELQGLVVATGPGSFTGLRIGLAVAKGIAVAKSLPVAGISLLDVASMKLTDAPEPLYLLIPFKRDEFFVAHKAAGRFSADRVETVATAHLDSFLSTRPSAIIGLDPKTPLFHELTSRTKVVEYDAGDILQLGVDRLADDDVDDLVSLEPLYLRPTPAELRLRQEPSSD
jgi:tRNA threonylcarbamoyladenosine biosynthesis protein TsaB